MKPLRNERSATSSAFGSRVGVDYLRERLTKDPQGHSVLLQRRTEPEGGVLDCVDNRHADCPIVPACRLRKVFTEAQHEFYRVLDQYTLADLIERPERLIKLLSPAMQA